MKQFAIGLVMLCLGGVGTAQAQSAMAPASRTDGKFYVAVDGGATFGGKTSSIVQGQVGYRVWPRIDLFVEGGRMQNVSSNPIAVRAGVVTAYLNTLGQGTAAATIKVPAGFGAIGARYTFPGGTGRLQPYALAAVGIASVKNNVKFALGGTDITGSIGNYGVQLGSDLSGTQTRALVSFGGGVTMAWNPVFVDVAVRYYRLFTKPTGTNVGSVYAGIGYKF